MGDSALVGEHSNSLETADHEAAQPLKPVASDEEDERLLVIVTERFDRVPPSKDIDMLAHILRDTFGAEMCLIGLVSTKIGFSCLSEW